MVHRIRGDGLPELISWSIITVNESGAITLTGSCIATKFVVNGKIDPLEFDLPFPERTWVVDMVRKNPGRGYAEYMVVNGSKREILRQERIAGRDRIYATPTGEAVD